MKHCHGEFIQNIYDLGYGGIKMEKKFAKNGLVGAIFFKLCYITDNEGEIKHFHTNVLIKY